ncbi:hypothetical protein KM043_011976 [Ampulex compressa]|nr:hypothetical protein KM043_011976 [Ampulex compressa]
MNGNIPKGPSLNDKSPSPDCGEKQNLLPPLTPTTPIIIQASKSPNASLRSRSRYRAGPTRKLRRRAVLKNGECNVLQSRISRRSLRFLQDIFTTLVDTQWRWTLLCFTLSFLLSWLGFAVIWWLIAFTHGDFEERHLPPFQVENNWTPCIYNIFSFTSCFLFSIETQHTIGYGSRSTTEECPEAIFVMCIQSIAGVMIQAFMVGIVFAKMSRPKQRTQTLLFSRHAVICQRDGELCLMFRVGDMRKSHIIGAAVRAQVIRSRTTKEGEILSQNQQELAVGTDGQNGNLFFIWPMTIVHKIDAESPFYHMSAEDMLTDRFEIVVILEGTIESTGQTTQARSSYVPQEILWGHRFEPMVSYSKERQGYEVDYSLFNTTTQVDTPLCSGRELAEFYRVQDELRHGTGVIVDEDLLEESYGHCRCDYRQPIVPYYRPRPPLIHMDSIRSDVSTEDSLPYRESCRKSNCTAHGQQVVVSGDSSGQQYKTLDVDPDAIQVMGEIELQQLPEAVNEEIVKNSQEIVYEEEPREPDSPTCRLVPRGCSTKRRFTNDDRRPPDSPGRSMYYRNILIGTEEGGRSFSGQKRRLSGSKKYLVLALDRANGQLQANGNAGNAGNAVARHSAYRSERLDAASRSVYANQAGSGDLMTRRKLRCKEEGERVVIDMERVAKRQSVARPREMIVSRSRGICEHSRSEFVLNSARKSPIDPTSPISDLSPESGFYDGNQWNSSPESNRKGLRIPDESVLGRNRRSYEDAQMQDVNEALVARKSESTSSDSDVSAKNLVDDVDMLEERKDVRVTTKRGISYTSV